jgi:O-antigen/teichoic acid export membrane protein
MKNRFSGLVKKNRFNIFQVKIISGDIIYNLIASAVPLIFLQFIIQPYIARIIGTEQYGGMLTVVGLLNIGMGMFGSPLNNARLIDDHHYNEQKGDYNLFLSLFVIINTVFLFLVISMYQVQLHGIEYFLLGSISIFSIVTNYLAADYRIRLDYKQIMVSKIFQTIGFFLGCFLFILTKKWEWVFFVGYGLSLIYMLCTTSLWKEPFRSTVHLKKTSIRILFLVLSASLGSVLTYFDRLIIFPVFGGTELSIYYAASIVGKTVFLVTGPLAGVLLSYSVRLKSVSKKQFFIYVLVLFVFSIIGYLICYAISKPLIRLLYPDCLSGSLIYIPYTVAIAMLGVVYSFIWPLVLRFGKNFYPLIVTLLKAVVYLPLTFIFIKPFGMMGVNYANLFASVVQVLIVVVLGFRVCKRSNE